MKKFILPMWVSTLGLLIAVGAAAREPAKPCMSIDAPIGFRVSWASYTSGTIAFGSLPNTVETIGETHLGGMRLRGSDLYSRTSDGQIWLKVRTDNEHTNVAKPMTASAQLTGILQLSRDVRVDIRKTFGDAACVSGIALEGSHQRKELFDTSAVIYMNGTEKGFRLDF
jgi:hypothetical protein